MITDGGNKVFPKERRFCFAFLGVKDPHLITTERHVGKGGAYGRDRRVVKLVHQISKRPVYRHPREHGSAVSVGEVKGMVMLKGCGKREVDGDCSPEILVKRGRGSYVGIRAVADEKADTLVFRAQGRTAVPVKVEFLVVNIRPGCREFFGAHGNYNFSVWERIGDAGRAGPGVV